MGNPAKLFNTHFYIKKLEAAGVPEAQAEVHAEAFTTLLEDRLATKDDLEKLKQHLQHQIDNLDAKLQHAIDNLDAKLQHAIENLEARIDVKLSTLKHEMTKWFLGSLLTQIALVVSLFKLFH